MPVAQWIEHQLPELGVVGSTPIGHTIDIRINYYLKIGTPPRHSKGQRRGKPCQRSFGPFDGFTVEALNSRL